MIVNLNGWPGVGKLTTARELSKLVSGKLLDNHTLLNVGKALARDGSPEFYALARAVRSVAFDASSAVEKARRIAGADRALLGKRQDPELLRELANTRVLYDDGAKYRLTVDTAISLRWKPPLRFRAGLKVRGLIKLDRSCTAVAGWLVD